MTAVKAQAKRVRRTHRRMMADRLTIGQRWRRRRDDRVATVRQVHRADRTVELRLPDGQTLTETFTDLRLRWEQAR